MSGPGLRPLNYGTIPTRAGLGIVCSFEGLPLGVTGVDELHRQMRGMLQRGEMSTLRVLLERVGFAWPDPLAATVAARRS